MVLGEGLHVLVEEAASIRTFVNNGRYRPNKGKSVFRFCHKLLFCGNKVIIIITRNEISN